MIHPFDSGGTADENRGSAAGDAGFDELALRRLLHEAVRDVSPHRDALERLQRAVPARRARRRQAMVGAAAGLLLICTAVPALLQATGPGGTDSTAAANASPRQDGGSAPGVEGGTEQGGGAFGPAGQGANGGSGGSANGASPSAASSALARSAGSPDAAAAAPACSRAQLGAGSAQLGLADAAGRVYGSFQVVNISSSTCSIPGEGRITVTGVGGVDATKIQVVDHTAGDPATGLPDPATAPTSVVLAPGKAYQIQFAWIPASSGGVTGCTSTTGGSAGSSGSGGTTGSTSGGSGSNTTSTTGLVNAPSDGGSASPGPVLSGITLTHIPEEGDPSAASTTIAGACSGTLYRTAVLLAP